MTWGSVILGLFILVFLAVLLACFLGFLDVLDDYQDDPDERGAVNLSGISPKEARVVVRRAMKAGCTVQLSGGTHLKITTPDGQVVRGALTGGRNSAVYLYRDLRKTGVFERGEK